MAPGRNYRYLFVALVALGACSDDAPRAVDVEIVPETLDEVTPEVEVGPPPVGRVVINEIDCRSDPVEWVELVNVGDAPVELDGYRVDDKPGTGGIAAPRGTLAPGQRVVVRGDIGISCSDDGVYLSADGHAVDQAPPRRGDAEVSSWGRVPDGTGPFTQTAPTPLHDNIALADLRGTIFEGEAMPIIDLYVSEAAEQQLRATEKTYAPAVWQWTDAAGTSAPQHVDIRIKGSITLRPWDAKPSLKVNFSRHDERGPRAFRGAKKLTLHNLAYDPSGIREWLAYEVMREGGQPAPRVGWAIVRVNGVSKHLYAVVESYDDLFLEDWFASTSALYEADGDFISGLSGFDLEEGDATVGMAPLEQLAQRVFPLATNGSVPTQVLPEIDWIQLGQMFGFEDLLAHTDGMRSGCHNYFMHLGGDGRWSFLPWSVDLSLLADYGQPGPLSSCSAFAHLCDRDERCSAWFDRARDEAAQVVMRSDFRERALAHAARLQDYADRRDEPWGDGDFWGSRDFDLPMQAGLALDMLETRARGIRCATAARRTDPPTPPVDNPTCDGFLGPKPNGPK